MSASPELNAAQLEAVEHRDGPLLVLAGPGSGKTRVITRRIARLVESGIYASRVLALTFTNKAATEMGHRVERLLPGTRVWVSTFHRFCASLLRYHATAVGLQPNFTILDTPDQTTLLRQVLSDLDIDSSSFPPAKLLSRIGKAKHRLQSPDDLAQHLQEGRGSIADQVAARAYKGYQELLLRSNAVDFDDLLAHVARLLVENEEVRLQLASRFRYILVDEYQDTNFAQYMIVRTLAAEHRNLCVTGDPDQSIYGWRGAEIGNILQFERDFPESKVVRLEQNYRSTQAICRAADRLIVHNQRRKHKQLFTVNPEGAPVEPLYFADQHLEAEGIATLIRQIAQHEQRAWGEFAVFYRVNALSRTLELALGRHRIPYQVAAGLAFYERAEVKDLLAYLRLILNPADRTALQRIINTPARGLGKTTVDRLLGWADQQRIPPLEAARNAGQYPGFTRRAVVSLGRFAEMIDRLSRTPLGGVAPLFDELLRVTRYQEGTTKGDPEADLQRAANIAELRSTAAQYDQDHADNPTLEGFLENSSLVADLDAVDEAAGRVTLMTLHAAKGLEFPVVFIVGVEEGLLPHDRSLRSENPQELEEERRLMFVGVTRARERLCLTRTFLRDQRGQSLLATPSRFLDELGLTTLSTPTQLPPLAPLPAPERRSSAGFGGDPFPPPQEFARRDTAAQEGESAAEQAVPRPASRSPSRRPPAPPAPPTPEEIEAKKRRSAKLAGIPHLTTAANLLAGNSDQVPIPFRFEVGMLVRHPKLGMGEVITSSGTGSKQSISVRFQTGEERSFLTLHAPLQPVGLR